MYMEGIRREGSGGDQSRAAIVWDQLKEKINTLQSGVSFVEALHDEEATASTLSSRATELRSLGVPGCNAGSIRLCC